MVAKKDPKDKFKRITFTASPVLEKNVIEKAKAEKRTISGVIVELLEKWLSDEPIHTDVTDMNQSLPLPPIVDIERMKAEILSEVMKEISTKEKENETVEPVQSALVHTDMNQCESITEAPIPAERDESHTNIPMKEESIQDACDDKITTKEAVLLWKGSEISSDDIEYDKLAKRISTYAKSAGINSKKIGRDKYYDREAILQYIKDNPLTSE